jgi:hypothetical protein
MSYCLIGAIFFFLIGCYPGDLYINMLEFLFCVHDIGF